MTAEIKLEKIIKKDVSLAEHCSYKIGGVTRFFAQPGSLQELEEIIEYCQKKDLNPFIFGLGSNILFPDRPDNETLFVSLKKMVGWEKKNKNLFLEAGFPLSFLAYTGQPDLIFTHLLPGTLGASVYINARCYEGEMSRILGKVYYLDLKNLKNGIQELESKACNFAYKESIFQENPWLILGAEIKAEETSPNWLNDELAKAKSINLSALDNFFRYFGKGLFSRVKMGVEEKEKLQQIAADRERKKQFSYPSCGSVFKNNYEIGVPTGMLVEQLGLKGLTRGGAKISPYHGNFIINFDRASSGDVKYLIQLVQDKVNSKFGFIPEPEVVIVNGQES